MNFLARIVLLFFVAITMLACDSDGDSTEASGDANFGADGNNSTANTDADGGSSSTRPTTIPANNQPPNPDLPDSGCAPQCEGKTCGDDGCGGTCGSCPSEQSCSDEGICESACGVCAPNTVCGLDPETPTLCVGGPCGEITYEGLCIGDMVEWCQDEVLYSYDCALSGDNFSCGENEAVGFDCICAPSCAGKACGDDSCGGSCGDCPEAGEVCNEAFACAPADSVAGNLCENAVEIKSVPFSHSANTSLYSDLYNSSGGCDNVSNFGEGIAEVVYRFTPSADHTYRFSLTETTGPTLIYVATDCSALETSCQGMSEDLYGGGAYSVALKSGQNYFVFVDGIYDGDTGPYLLEVDICTPDCAGKKCGDDGCGGTCGTCGDSEICGADGLCAQCTPSCDALTCGPDGCGGTCGVCDGDNICLEGNCADPEDACGTCAPGTICGVDPDSPRSCVGGDCGDTDLVGACDGNVMSYCYEEQLYSMDCDLYPQYACTFLEVEGYYACACEPACNGKACGDDGCGGQCGECAGALVCTGAGHCIDPENCTPECGDKLCGDDGCGGACGVCAFNEECSDAGQCEAFVDCGECAPNTTCGASIELPFYCGAGDCGDVPASGICFGNVAAHCADSGELRSIDCAVHGGVYNTCGLVASDSNLYDCVCTPACAENQQCGGDGCGGSCGTCGEGQVCGVEGACLTPGIDGQDISGFRLTQVDSVREFIFPEDSFLLPGGYAVVARDCSRTEFETFWAVSLPSYVLFFNSGSSFPMMNGKESYSLYNKSGAVLDGPSIAMKAKHCYQRKDPVGAAGLPASWADFDDGGVPDIANPGSGAPKGSSLFISEFCDVLTKGAFKYEFVEIKLGSTL